ncbi:hypothetical protein [Alicyclobacillus ferrooxydans]|uniref:hypothetical protein n=1 Tax=Alicyclobacillus ferrooxydans TaxID=471514 RepID=UPI0012EE93F9|nr:hypothetical protein [Alicyclobacillus ferrooxydans]
MNNKVQLSNHGERRQYKQDSSSVSENQYAMGRRSPWLYVHKAANQRILEV